MTVLENLELGAYLRKDKDGIAKDMDDVFKNSRVCWNVRTNFPVRFPVASSRCWLWGVR